MRGHLVARMVRPTIKRKAARQPGPQAGGTRALAAWLGTFALVGQLLLPVLYDAVSARAESDAAYADFVRSFGGAVHLCAAPLRPGGAGQQNGKAPAGDPLQCPLCQPFAVLGGLLAPASPTLPPPSAAEDSPQPKAWAAALPARIFAFAPEARGPPIAA